MAYSQTLYLVQGDRLPQLKFTIRDESTAAPGKTLDPDDETTWNPVNITGFTVTLKIREVGSDTLTSDLDGTVTDGAAGECVFIFDPDTLSTSGTFEAELSYTTGAGLTQTVYDLIKFQVRAEF